MKKHVKSIVSLLMVAIMMFTAIPVTGFAVNDEQSGTQIVADNSIGDVLSSALEEGGGDDDDGEAVNYLSSVELDGRYATVKLRTEVYGSIVVAVYDDSGSKMLASGKTEVYPEYDENDLVVAQSVEVVIDTTTMPENFLLKVFLLNEENHALCQNLEIRDYTKAYQEFLAQTTEDFEEEKVVNFDEDKTNNFAVLSDGAKTVYSNNETNILESADEETGVYIFSTVTDEITNLKVGDIFYYENGETAIAIKIGSITVDGDKVTLTKGESEVSDIFDVVKIDKEAYADESSYADSEEVEPQPAMARAQRKTDLDVDKDKNIFTKRFSFNKWNLLSGYADITVKAHLKIYYDLHWFGADYIDATAYTDAVVSFNVTFDGKFSKSPVIATPNIEVIPGIVGIKASIQPIFEVSAKLTVNSTTSAKIGFECKGHFKKNGMTTRSIKELDTSKTSPTLDGSFSAKVGLKISATVTAIEICHITLGAEAGVRLSGKIVHASEKDGVKHSCKNCVNGKAMFYVTLSAKLLFGWENKRFKWVPLDWSNDVVNYDFGKFYFSITNRTFGWGACKYTSYRVIISVYNNGQIATGAKVDGTNVSKDGRANNYYQTGLHNINVNYNGTERTYKVNVGTKPMSFRIDLKDSTSDLHTTHVDKNKDNRCDVCGARIKNDNGSSGSWKPPEDLTEKQIIEFGSYPQSKVTDSETLSALDGMSKNWISYGYYSGRGNGYDGKMQPSDYMKYADLQYNGAKYRAVNFTKYRPAFTYETSSASKSYQNDNGYHINTTYYFKYEPLKWHILDPNTGFIMCESIIDSQPYQNTIHRNSTDDECYQDFTCKAYANDYATSSIRKWLNSDFYNHAFSSSQKANIKTMVLNNDCYSSSYSQYNSAATNDKIFLISYDEAKNSTYGFSSSTSTYDASRRASGTDYAKCQGLFQDTDNSWWWLRSPFNYSDSACYVNAFGCSRSNFFVCSAHEGVRPACKIKLNNYTSIQLESANSISISSRLRSLLSFTQTASFGCAVPSEEYIMLAVKDKTAENLLDSNNLLFIDQKTAESNVIEFTYTLKEETSNYDVLILGKCGHDYKSEITKEATCTQDGEMTFTCTNCGDTYTETISATQHNPVTASGTPATCTEDGLTDGTKCSVCGTVIKAQEVIKATGHTDNDQDGVCDMCGEDANTNKPTEPSDPTKYCTCLCHKTGFMGFIYKIIRIFWKIFRINKTCVCGEVHY